MMNIWLVEDVLSRERLEQAGQNAIALLGTHIHDCLVSDILENYPAAGIMLALDEDATAVAIRWKNRIGSLFRNFAVVPLSKDIKDMTQNELQELLR